MADGVIKRVHNGRVAAGARTQHVRIETKPKGKLPRKKPKPPPKDVISEEVGLFVSGDYYYDSDDETLIIPLSRSMSHDEQTIVKNAIMHDCRTFARLTHINGATVRIRLRDNSGETLCERQLHECVKEAVENL